MPQIVQLGRTYELPGAKEFQPVILVVEQVTHAEGEEPPLRIERAEDRGVDMLVVHPDDERDVIAHAPVVPVHPIGIAPHIGEDLQHLLERVAELQRRAAIADQHGVLVGSAEAHKCGEQYGREDRHLSQLTSNERSSHRDERYGRLDTRIHRAPSPILHLRGPLTNPGYQVSLHTPYQRPLPFDNSSTRTYINRWSKPMISQLTDRPAVR